MVILPPANSIILLAATVAFENFTFSLVEPVNTEHELETPFYTKLSVSQPIQTNVGFLLPRSLLQHVLQQLYQLPPDQQTESIQRDLAGEITNTFTGQLIRMAFPGKPFCLGLPSTTLLKSTSCIEAIKIPIAVDQYPAYIILENEFFQTISHLPHFTNPSYSSSHPEPSPSPDAW